MCVGNLLNERAYTVPNIDPCLNHPPQAFPDRVAGQLEVLLAALSLSRDELLWFFRCARVIPARRLPRKPSACAHLIILVFQTAMLARMHTCAA